MAAPIDLISLAAVKVKSIGQDGTAHPASGFLYGHNGQIYVVTNWHVMTGRDPSRRAISDTGSLVVALEVTFHWTQNQQSIAPYRGVARKYEVLDVLSMRGKWREHSDPGVDVALLPIELPPNALRCSLDTADFQKGYEPQVGDLVFVVGYPRNLAVGMTTLPLWKGGTIASDPAVRIDRKPKALIDCDTYEGMSGAPVIARRQSGLFKHTAEGGMSDESVFGEIQQFFGIYSGRVRQQSDDSDQSYVATKFGVVWSSEVVQEILDSPHEGSILR